MIEESVNGRATRTFEVALRRGLPILFTFLPRRSYILHDCHGLKLVL